MIGELQHIIPNDFSDNSKVWIYQASRPFQDREVLEVNEQLLHFYQQWTSHGAPVKGWAQLLFGRFIVVMADEEASNIVSGCSTDAMVRIVKSIEKQYSVSLFERMSLTFIVNGKAEILPMNQVEYALDKGFLQLDTLFFNNLVNVKSDLLTKWLVPLKESWLMQRLKLK